MSYVQGFLVAVPEANKEAYRKTAEEGWKIFSKYGAISTMEAWESDVPEGEHTSFPMAVKREPGEKVVFSWILWPDKETHDKAWERIMQDPAMDGMTMPFDGKRMMWGGFEELFVGT